MTTTSKRQRERFYTYRKKKFPNVFIYKNPDAFQKERQFPLHFIYKKPDTLRYAVFHEKFEVGIYIKKA